MPVVKPLKKKSSCNIPGILYTSTFSIMNKNSFIEKKKKGLRTISDERQTHFNDYATGQQKEPLNRQGTGK